jgi:spore maturation protein CgeB/GT2 family glycosyltransferase
MREGVRLKSLEIADLKERVSELQRATENQEVALKEKDIQIEELAQRSRILQQGLDKIEGYFSKLLTSRSFQFMVYTARRMGLISRTPRRSVEAIKNEFSAMRKALKLARQKALPETMPQAFSTPALATPLAAPVNLRAGHEETPLDQIAQTAALRKAVSGKHALALPPALSAQNASVCFIVLHHSGDHHIQNLLASFLKVNTHLSAEFCIVLHACQDRSREVIASFQDRLQIKVIDCAENRSFSDSNNRAAEQTNADYLIFLNNDIIFQEEVTGELVRCLQDPRIGIVGLRLLYPPDYPKVGGGIQHAGIKFRPDSRHFFYRPFNLGALVQIVETPWVLEKFPAVTGALLACRRRDFFAAGGFFEGYLYGYEDVDLSLSFRRSLGLHAVSANHISGIHNESATGRLDKTEAVWQRRLNNIRHLARRHGWYLRRKILADKLAGNDFFSEEPLNVAFAVTEATPATAAGDFFSASELADACAREFGWKIRYLSRHEDWYDLTNVDVLVVLLDAYELSKIRHANPDLIKIAWLRNWFERWISGPDFDQYDLFLCSSTKSARWLEEKHRKKACVFPLATNPARFINAKAEHHLESDYCFTGSYWAVEREIGTAVRPEKLTDYKFAVFGKGWDSHPHLGAYARGFVPYVEMPKVYASTRIVVDDANHVTKGWGSVNSRVFDALAAGALVITNGDLGAAEIFDGELPTYRSPEELQTLLSRYLGDDAQRHALVDRLRRRVLSRHTYRHRARTLKHLLISRARLGYRIGLKIGAPNRREIQHWGDYHFALSLGRYLAQQGHSFRIDCLDEWDRPDSFGDDVVIVLRGLSRYQPRPGQINLMWNISHPDTIQDEEYEEFDHVFVASELYAAQLAARLWVSVSALLQCTDPDVFYPDENPKISAEQVLFVGNSRKQYREAVRFAVEAKLPLAVYGTHWRMFIPESFLRGEYIDNSILRQHYRRAHLVLNDHWPSMQQHGFVSNRIFDAAAAGAFVLSDRVSGMDELFGSDLVTYKDETEFREQVRYHLAHPEKRRARAERLRARVLAAHTFAHRAASVLTKIKELDQRKRGPGELYKGAHEGAFCEISKGLAG